MSCVRLSKRGFGLAVAILVTSSLAAYPPSDPPCENVIATSNVLVDVKECVYSPRGLLEPGTITASGATFCDGNLILLPLQCISVTAGGAFDEDLCIEDTGECWSSPENPGRSPIIESVPDTVWVTSFTGFSIVWTDAPGEQPRSAHVRAGSSGSGNIIAYFEDGYGEHAVADGFVTASIGATVYDVVANVYSETGFTDCTDASASSGPGTYTARCAVPDGTTTERSCGGAAAGYVLLETNAPGDCQLAGSVRGNMVFTLNVNLLVAAEHCDLTGFFADSDASATFEATFMGYNASRSIETEGFNCVLQGPEELGEGVPLSISNAVFPVGQQLAWCMSSDVAASVDIKVGEGSASATATAYPGDASFQISGSGPCP
jgi:hypothetical protein